MKKIILLALTALMMVGCDEEMDRTKIGFAFPQGNKTSYKEPWVYIDSERVFVEHLSCVFVHQLQHALRLCGIEKTIEL